MKDICKEFPGVVALDNITFDLLPGEVHLLLGEKRRGQVHAHEILSGVYSPTRGTIVLGDRDTAGSHPRNRP